MVRYKGVWGLVLTLVTAAAGQDFRPLDNNIGPLLDEYLHQGQRSSVSHVLDLKINEAFDQVESFLSDKLVSKKKTEFLSYLKDVFTTFDDYNVTKGVQLKRVNDSAEENDLAVRELGATILDNIVEYARHHVVKIQLLDLVDNLRDKVKRSTDMASSRSGRLFAGPNAFLTGFGLGFLAFGFKKLMLPFFIGAQILKSLLLALFLPSIIGGLGKIVGKGVNNFASASGNFGSFGHQNQMDMNQMEDFDFKDQGGYETQLPDAQTDGSNSVFSYAYPNGQYDSLNRFPQQGSIGVLPAPIYPSPISNRYTSQSQKVSYLPNANNHGSFYTKNSWKNTKHQDYKVFHNIPSSSLLLTNYDPFYSPLLSRMDSVFKQLGYETEACRERLICLMYKNPAKFAPYSNLISAQLSRELNELRKPSTDNPDILRFFKYMKSAKDGQDGVDCMRVYPGCYDNRETTSPPMVKTYNEINKLVHARKLSR